MLSACSVNSDEPPSAQLPGKGLPLAISARTLSGAFGGSSALFGALLAAEAAGVSESTVYRRLRDSNFRQELKEQRLRVYSHALQRLQVATEGAAEVLEEVMRDKSAPLSARVKCAVHVLELADKGPQPEFVDRRLQSSVERMLDDL